MRKGDVFPRNLHLNTPAGNVLTPLPIRFDTSSVSKGKRHIWRRSAGAAQLRLTAPRGLCQLPPWEHEKEGALFKVLKDNIPIKGSFFCLISLYFRPGDATLPPYR